jgi:hypothetical protein
MIFYVALIEKKAKYYLLYSFNSDSLRHTSCYDNVPNSIFEREFEKLQRYFVTANRKHLKR